MADVHNLQEIKTRCSVGPKAPDTVHGEKRRKVAFSFLPKGMSQTLNWGASFLRDTELESTGTGKDLEHDAVCKSHLTGEREWSKR